MAVATLGARIPRVVPMTNEQYRAHQNLGRAEKKLIYLITYDAAPEKIARAQKTVNRWTSAWRRSCEKASASHRETVVR